MGTRPRRSSSSGHGSPPDGAPPEDSTSALRSASSPAGPSSPPGEFEPFYARHRDRIVRALALTLGDADLAADAVDEAMTKAFSRWARFGPNDNPSGWVYRVAFNWSMSFVRRRRRRDELYASQSLADERPDGSTADPVELVGDGRLASAVGALSVPHRAVVVCRIYLDLSIADTADHLGVRPGTVKSRLSRALSELEATLTSSTNPGEGS